MYLMRPGGQSQFSAQLAAQYAGDARLARICAYIIENPRADLTVPALAARAAMSERSFARHFVSETGFTPAQFVERARLDEACRRLAGGNASLDAVSADAGFGAAERMRRAFIRHLGVTPGRYRERFHTARRDAPIHQEGHAHAYLHSYL
jgi:transcriptional regulator GlxA family with amidase domain